MFIIIFNNSFLLFIFNFIITKIISKILFIFNSIIMYINIIFIIIGEKTISKVGNISNYLERLFFKGKQIDII